MKMTIKLFIAIIAVGLTLVSCRDKEEGFLNIDENAGFTVDSILVYQKPSTTSNQYKYKTAYMTTSMEGIEGTRPLKFTFAEITGDNIEGVQLLQKVIDVKTGIGKIVIPCEHNLPIGRYKISIWIENVYNKVLLKDVLTVIVKEKP